MILWLRRDSEPVILYPFMDYNSEKFNVKRKAFDSSRLVVGFASSPMGENRWRIEV